LGLPSRGFSLAASTGEGKNFLRTANLLYRFERACGQQCVLGTTAQAGSDYHWQSALRDKSARNLILDEVMLFIIG
jgi:hypothetical protein